MNKIYLIICAALFSACSKSQVVPQNSIPKQKTYLALGDSYTIGQSVDEKSRWPNQLVDSLKTKNVFFADAEIIAQTGWRTDNLQAAVATNTKFDYDLVSLLIT